MRASMAPRETQTGLVIREREPVNLDTAGNTQPEHHDKRFGTCVIHHTFGIEVVVR